MNDDINLAIFFASYMIKLQLLLILLPFLLVFIHKWLHMVLGFFFRFGYEKNSSYKRSIRTKNIGKLLSLITLPGTLFRVTLMFLFLKLKGWVLYLSYAGYVGGSNRSLSDERRTGFIFSMRPNNRRAITLKEMIQASLIGYIPLLLAYYMWKTRADQIDFLIYLSQGNLSIFWIYFFFYYLMFALVIGGGPIPEETMLPIYYIIGKYPHLIIGIIGAYIISFLLSLMEIGYLGFEGKRLAEAYFLLFSSILFFKVILDEKRSKITKRGLDDMLLEMEIVELL